MIAGNNRKDGWFHSSADKEACDVTSTQAIDLNAGQTNFFPGLVGR